MAHQLRWWTCTSEHGFSSLWYPQEVLVAAGRKGHLARIAPVHQWSPASVGMSEPLSKGVGTLNSDVLLVIGMCMTFSKPDAITFSIECQLLFKQPVIFHDHTHCQLAQGSPTGWKKHWRMLEWDILQTWCHSWCQANSVRALKAESLSWTFFFHC